MLGLHFTPACVLLSVCSRHFTHSLHFTPGPQSPVRSLRLTLTDKEMLSLWWQVNLEAFGIMLEIQLLEKVKTKNFERRKMKPVSTRIQRSETKRNLQWLFELDYQTFLDISLPSQWSNSHCPTDDLCSCWVEVILYSLSCNAIMITEYGKNMLVYKTT